jgi:hypothetical protein
MMPPEPDVPESGAEPRAGNPHILWRQLAGFIFWTTLFALLAAGPLGVVLCLLIGGATFADAWVSGIYKQPDRKSFLNISPMAWGIVMSVLFIVGYPAYLLNRNKLRTIKGTNGFYWATVVMGALVLLGLLLNLAGFR